MRSGLPVRLFEIAELAPCQLIWYASRPVHVIIIAVEWVWFWYRVSRAISGNACILKRGAELYEIDCICAFCYGLYIAPIRILKSASSKLEEYVVGSHIHRASSTLYRINKDVEIHRWSYNTPLLWNETSFADILPPGILNRVKIYGQPTSPITNYNV